MAKRWCVSWVLAAGVVAVGCTEVVSPTAPSVVSDTGAQAENEKADVQRAGRSSPAGGQETRTAAEAVEPHAAALGCARAIGAPYRKANESRFQFAVTDCNIRPWRLSAFQRRRGGAWSSAKILRNGNGVTIVHSVNDTMGRRDQQGNVWFDVDVRNGSAASYTDFEVVFCQGTRDCEANGGTLTFEFKIAGEK